MRTTLNIDDEALRAARELAVQHRISLGDATSFLIKRGLSVSLPHIEKNGFALFNVEPGMQLFGAEGVDRATQAEDEEVSKFFPERADDTFA